MTIYTIDAPPARAFGKKANYAEIYGAAAKNVRRIYLEDFQLSAYYEQLPTGQYLIRATHWLDSQRYSTYLLFADDGFGNLEPIRLAFGYWKSGTRSSQFVATATFQLPGSLV